MAKIKCQACGAEVHSIQLHLAKHDCASGIALAQYKRIYPDAPLLSPEAEAKLAEKQAQQSIPVEQPHVLYHAMSNVAPITSKPLHVSAIVSAAKRPMHEVFELPDSPAVKNGRGDPIPVTVYEVNPLFAEYVPEVDKGHVWDADDLKNQLMALELNMPLYSYGHKGTGKTTDIEQICARTRRPLIRVQHTANTEESHLLGQRIIKDGETPFEMGPLPIAMRHGLVFLADEYDFALPSVLAVYQPVLEGKSLMIKEAGESERIVRPNPHYRFVATGNTNGSGDSTGLYAGTSVQNAANYDRFGMTIQKKYMPEEAETQIVRNRSGISEKEAKKLVGFAKEIRTQFEAGKLSDTISTRALVNISKVGLLRGNVRIGVQLCFANKLNQVDRAVVDGVAQRIYGGAA